MKKLRILLADDHKMLREGLRVLLDSQPGLQVVGEAASGKEALAKAGELNPDAGGDGSVHARTQRIAGDRDAQSQISGHQGGGAHRP